MTKYFLEGNIFRWEIFIGGNLFVKSEEKGTDDIFIAGSRKAEAQDGDRVEVKIIKK